MDDRGPSFLTMIGVVAIVVATVILVFFGVGYALGRIFLGRADLLDLRGRPAAHRGPDARGLRDGGVAPVPVRRDDRLRDRAAARVPRRRARARARDRGSRGAPAPGR